MRIHLVTTKVVALSVVEWRGITPNYFTTGGRAPETISVVDPDHAIKTLEEEDDREGLTEPDLAFLATLLSINSIRPSGPIEIYCDPTLPDNMERGDGSHSYLG